MQVVATTHYGTTVTALFHSKFSSRALPGATHEDMAELHGRQNDVHQSHLNGLHQQYMASGSRGERKSIRKEIDKHANAAAKHQKMARFFENTNPNKASIPKAAKPAAPTSEPSTPKARAPHTYSRDEFGNIPKPTPRQRAEPEHEPDDEEHEDSLISHPSQGTTNLGHQDNEEPYHPPKPHRPAPIVTPERPEAPAKPAQNIPKAPTVTPERPTPTPARPKAPTAPKKPSGISHHAARLWHSLAPKVKSWFAATRPNSPMSKAHNTGVPRIGYTPKDTSDMHKEQSDYHVQQAHLAHKAAQVAPTPAAAEKATNIAATHTEKAANHNNLAKKAAVATPPKNPVKLPTGVKFKTPEEVTKGKDMSRKAPTPAAKPKTPTKPLPAGVRFKKPGEAPATKAPAKKVASTTPTKPLPKGVRFKKPEEIAPKAPTKKATAKPPSTVRTTKPAAKAPAKAPAKKPVPAKKTAKPKVKPINPAKL